MREAKEGWTVEKKETITALEGLGYVSASMVGAGSLVRNLPFQFLRGMGIFLAIVVFIRLMVMLVREVIRTP